MRGAGMLRCVALPPDARFAAIARPLLEQKYWFLVRAESSEQFPLLLNCLLIWSRAGVLPVTTMRRFTPKCWRRYDALMAVPWRPMGMIRTRNWRWKNFESSL